MVLECLSGYLKPLNQIASDNILINNVCQVLLWTGKDPAVMQAKDLNISEDQKLKQFQVIFQQKGLVSLRNWLTKYFWL